MLSGISLIRGFVVSFPIQSMTSITSLFVMIDMCDLSLIVLKLLSYE